MSALTATTSTRFSDRARDLAEAVYEGPRPAWGPGLGRKVLAVAYVVGSAIVWPLAALLLVGVVATVLA